MCSLSLLAARCWGLLLMFGVVTLLCAVAAVTFCAFARQPKSLIAAASGYLLAVLLLVPPSFLSAYSLIVQPTQLAIILTLVAFYGLARPNRESVLLALGGAAAGCWTAGLSGQGLPLALAVIAPVLISLFSAYCALRRPGFVSGRLRDEAVLIVLVFALGAALVPGAMDGWRSAVSLHGETLGQEELQMALFSLGLGGLFLLLGALYQWWFLGKVDS